MAALFGSRCRWAVGVTLTVVCTLVVGTPPWGAPPARAEAPAPAGTHSVGLFDPGTAYWYLRDGGGRTTRLRFGMPGDIPLMGDWDGDGVDSPAVYRPDEGLLLIRGGSDEVSFTYPMPTGGLPVVADTNGDGRDTVSLARGRRLFVMDGLGRGPAWLSGADPLPILLPDDTEALVAGDFDGDGVDEVAVVRRGVVELIGSRGRASLGYIGAALPVVGDWDGDGVQSMGGYEMWRAQFRFYGRHGGALPGTLPYGSTGMLPVAGTFGDLPGRDAAPVYRLGLPPMGRGDSGPDVMVLQRELARLRLFRGEIDGVFDEKTAYAVMTLHKVLGVERTYEWEPEDSSRILRFRLPPLPDRPDEPDRVEVDIGRQVLFVFRGGEIVEIVPVSTGVGYRYFSELRDMDVWARTPRGDFHFYRHVVGWDWVMRTETDIGGCNPYSGDYCVYSPWNFTPWYALHGYVPVPEYPASRGCIRLTLWDSDALEDDLFIGMPIHVWDEYLPPTHPGAPYRPGDLIH